MRAQLIVASGVLALTALAWFYLLRMAGTMTPVSMSALAMPEMQMWSAPDISMLFGMWALMMVAMMLPSALPVMLLALGTYQRRTGRNAYMQAALFLVGYVLVWMGFSAVAALTQAALHRAALLSPMMATSSGALGGVLLLVAGVYQWSPLKRTCIKHCRSPLDFLGSNWRDGIVGAFRLGAHHGLFCVGCCWALMALLFVAGVMNLLWVAVIAVLVLVEKAAPDGAFAGRLTGATLIVWGVLLVVRGA